MRGSGEEGRSLVDFAAHPGRQPAQLLVKQHRVFPNEVLAQSAEEKEARNFDPHESENSSKHVGSRASRQETDVYIWSFAPLGQMYAPQTLPDLTQWVTCKQQVFTSFPRHCRGYSGDNLDVAPLLTFIFTGPPCKYFSR